MKVCGGRSLAFGLHSSYLHPTFKPGARHPDRKVVPFQGAWGDMLGCGRTKNKTGGLPNRRVFSWVLGVPSESVLLSFRNLPDGTHLDGYRDIACNGQNGENIATETLSTRRNKS